MARLFLKTSTNRNGRKTVKGYYADFYDTTRGRRRLSLRTKDEATARAKLVELERKQAQGLWDPYERPVDEKGVTLGEAVKRFIKDREAYCSPATVDTYAYVLNSFARSVAPGTTVRAVSARHVKAFLMKPDQAGNLADSTRRSYTDRLRIFFGWCEKTGLAGPNPVPNKERRGKAARAAAQNDGPPAFFSEEEFLTVLSIIEADAKKKRLKTGNRWLLDAVRLAVGTGLRRGEVAHLRWNAVDLENRLLHVRNTEEFTTKNGLERTVPLVGGALQVVQRLYDERGPDPAAPGGGNVLRGATGGKLGEGYISKRFREYRRMAGLPEILSFHNLRHTFASWYVQRKGDLYHLKEILGHKDIKTTLRYAHLRPDALRAEMEHTFGAGLFRGRPARGDGFLAAQTVFRVV